MKESKLCYYIKIRRVGCFNWVPYKENGQIPVFLEIEFAKEKQDTVFQYGSMIMPISYPPNKESPLYKEKHMLIDSFV